MAKDQELKQINELLSEWSSGKQQVEKELLELLYPHIHQIAHRQFKSNKGASLQTTEIVNEAFIKIKSGSSVDWQNKNHFLAIAARVIRNVVVEHYRSENRVKRGGEHVHLTLERIQDIIEDSSHLSQDWLSVHELLNDLNNIDEAAAQVVEYKVFGGLTLPEIAAVMSVSESTVSRNWKFARLWLLAQMK